MSILSFLTYTPPFRLMWKPQPDISTYELALCVPMLEPFTSVGELKEWFDGLPAIAQRHFEVTASQSPDDIGKRADQVWDSLKSAASA